MEENYSLCLLRDMDRLWFHQIILFSNPLSLLIPKTLKPPQLISEPITCPSSSLSLSTFSNEEISSDISSPTGEENSPPITLLDDSNNEDEKKERPTRLNLIRSRIRSHSSSPSTQKHHKNHRYSGSARKLEKSMSCRSLGDLELEEVKGFIDLGFVFEKEHLSPRMMSVIPGLQRLGSYHKTKLIDVTEVTKDDKSRQEEEKRGIMRPYLSEAWLIRRPDSPLLNLRVPRVSAAADMKKHLRFWARTVASEIQQES